jgi:hypothetical protein
MAPDPPPAGVNCDKGLVGIVSLGDLAVSDVNQALADAVLEQVSEPATLNRQRDGKDGIKQMGYRLTILYRQQTSEV